MKLKLSKYMAYSQIGEKFESPCIHQKKRDFEAIDLARFNDREQVSGYNYI